MQEPDNYCGSDHAIYCLQNQIDWADYRISKLQERQKRAEDMQHMAEVEAVTLTLSEIINFKQHLKKQRDFHYNQKKEG